MNKLLCYFGFHKWVGKHYHSDTDIVWCNGGCWCTYCGFIR